jgi:glycosyltransferase involved in cell wall biosynthesis
MEKWGEGLLYDSRSTRCDARRSDGIRRLHPAMRNDMRILCISPHFPPFANPEAFCGGKMVKVLTDAGHDVVVLCRTPSPEQPIDRSLCWKPLESLARYVDAPSIQSASLGQKPLAVYYGLSYRTLSQGLLIQRLVRRAKQLHHEKHFDVVYSRSFPMYAHPVGYWCSRLLNLPWVANINDPWDIWHPQPITGNSQTPTPRAKWRTLVSRYWLRKTLTSAKLVTYPSSRLHEFQVERSGIDHNAEIIAHIGYAGDHPDLQTSKFTLVHAGLLEDATRRSASGLLAGLAQFLRACPFARSVTRMVLVGRQHLVTADSAKRLGLDDVVECVGRVPYEESLRYIASASVCVLVEGKMADGIYFPSKLADYIAAHKPILALSPARGVVAELAREGGIHRVDADDEGVIASAISDFYRAFIEGRLGEHCPSDVLVHQVSPDVVVEKFLGAVETACHGRSAAAQVLSAASDAFCGNGG